MFAIAEIEDSEPDPDAAAENSQLAGPISPTDDAGLGQATFSYSPPSQASVTMMVLKASDKLKQIGRGLVCCGLRHERVVCGAPRGKMSP